MTPDAFIRKWDGVKLREKQASQEHFLDLCALVGVPSPAEADPEGKWFCFEKGASKAGGGEGWADVRPSWLVNAHQALDAAVAAAYGWEDYSPEMTDEVILSRLLALNLSRSHLVTSLASGSQPGHTQGT